MSHVEVRALFRLLDFIFSIVNTHILALAHCTLVKEKKHNGLITEMSIYCLLAQALGGMTFINCSDN